MELIFKIAWRNILRHKGKSIVIGVILFLGAFLMTLGNGVIAGMDKGLEENIVNAFLGDIVIISDKQKDDTIMESMYGNSLEQINNYKDIKNVLLKEPNIDKFIPAGKNIAMAINEDGGDPGFVYLLGVDFREYQIMFPGNMKAIEGRLLGEDERGVLVGEDGRKSFYDYTNIWVIPEESKVVENNLSKDAKENRETMIVKDKVVFMGMSNDNSTMDIRTGVKGIIKYKALNNYWGSTILIDIESYRECMGYFAAAQKSADISDDKKKLLEMSNTDMDNMFAEDDQIVQNIEKKEETKITQEINVNEQAVEAVDLEKGTYNLVFIKVKKGANVENTVTKLNKELKQKLGVRAVTWKKASGVIGSMSMLIRVALFIFVMFMFFVAIIIIVNTLSMAALERTSEIGMMRAVGARKGFISSMFFGETVILSFVFGGIGIICGTLTVFILAALKITSDQGVVQLLYGGDTFRPVMTAEDILVGIVQLALVTLIAMIYPIKVARSITPLDAISRD